MLELQVAHSPIPSLPAPYGRHMSDFELNLIGFRNGSPDNSPSTLTTPPASNSPSGTALPQEPEPLTPGRRILSRSEGSGGSVTLLTPLALPRSHSEDEDDVVRDLPVSPELALDFHRATAVIPGTPIPAKSGLRGFRRIFTRPSLPGPVRQINNNATERIGPEQYPVSTIFERSVSSEGGGYYGFATPVRFLDDTHADSCPELYTSPEHSGACSGSESSGRFKKSSWHAHSSGKR